MTDIKIKRFQFLHELYKESEQDELKSCNAYKIGAILGFDENTTDKIMRYFINEWLITKKPAKPNQPKGTIAITHSGICHVETTLKKRAQFFRELKKGLMHKKSDSPYIKAGGNIVAGGDVIVGDKNIKKQDIPTIKKEKWYQTKTFKYAVITLVITLLGGGIPAWLSLGNKTDPDSRGNTNIGSQSVVSPKGGGDVYVTQSQGVDPKEYGETQRVLGKTEQKLTKITSEKQELEKIVNAYKKEDNERRTILTQADNIEKTKLLVKIFQEQDKGNISKEEASKLSGIVNKALWEDLKSFIEDKNIKIDEYNQSLVVSGIFKAKVTGGGYRARYNPATIVYVLTPEGNKLYEISKTEKN